MKIEDDGMDEAICPADFRVNGLIVDDLLHEILVQKVPAGCQLTAIMVCAIITSNLALF